MPSFAARFFNSYIRFFVRRRDWGNEQALARRSRRVFGAPRLYGNLVLKGLRSERVDTSDVHGEWITPPNASPHILMYIHGGGYVSCSSVTHRPITAALARLIGCRVFSADYRLAPEARFPAALDDVIRIYEWLVNDEANGLPVAIAGDSAGGGLTLALAVHARDAGLPAPACIVALSPWTDLAGTGASLHSNDGECAMFRSQNIYDFARAYLGNASPTDPRASPVYAKVHDLPPALFQVGSTELLLDDSRCTHDRILAAGGKSRITIYDDVPHGWQLLTPLAPESKNALREVAAFVSENLSVHNT